MQCSNPFPLHKYEVNVPCGRCIHCRIKRSTQWTMRLKHEASLYPYDGYFVTLTYNDDNLPQNNTLVKNDLQKFHKRLRKSLPGKFRYYSCGEYGEEIHRPHYQTILLGLDFSDLSTHDIIRAKWTLGHVFIVYASQDSMRYVTDYKQKKFLTSDKQKLANNYGGRLHPFQICSQK